MVANITKEVYDKLVVYPNINFQVHVAAYVPMERDGDTYLGYIKKEYTLTEQNGNSFIDKLLEDFNNDAERMSEKGKVVEDSDVIEYLKLIKNK